MASEEASDAGRHGEPIAIGARTVGGELHTVEVKATDTISILKECLAASCGVARSRLKLLQGTRALTDAMQLGEDAGIGPDVELTMIIGPPVPEWAKELGLSGEHPALLRSHLAKHGLESPAADASDDDVWAMLEKAHASQREKRTALQGWRALLTLSRGGEPTAMLCAKPGETLDIDITGWVVNNNGDTCIQQVILALDSRVAAEVYNGVPGRGRDLKRSVSFQVPVEPGVYMLWRYNDLMYNMRDACHNFRQRHGDTPRNAYPEFFVGWVVVET
eukprot:CAMPEP_0179065480 /NCGR_PEP_ID=MMETSP0796-20121207/28482_1 /TAXON_ID=73915 /ORGANISM="Pyrodinium bahamense, Strain pbaha01" /LENGTH=275 /DNA_ID=CAMNT_0020762453 /DNA_START=53 /DNA_END=880 /DNA_ORIENTATION=+